MEQQFDRNMLSCMDTLLQEVQNTELTQQIQLPDGMPDIGRIICGWGQCILRGKEWMSDRVGFSAGMMVWVLYAPEDGSEPRWIDTWIPFQMKWDLPEGAPEGVLRIHCLVRFVDARSVSPRKIMVRAGAAAQVEAYSPMRLEISVPTAALEGMELLESTYPLRLRREAGEKAFDLEQSVTVPEHMARPVKLLCCQVSPRVAEKKVMADKLVFRGSANMHLMYQGEEGRLHSWDCPVSFSQFEDLAAEHSPDAAAEVLVVPTALETELDEEGYFQIKCALTAQYSVTDRVLVNVAEDAFSPVQELSLEKTELEVPVILDSRREVLQAEQSAAAAGQGVEVRFLPELPRQRPQEGSVGVEIPGTFQVLGYGEDGALRLTSVRWEGQWNMKAADNCAVSVLALPQEPQLTDGSVRAELPMEITASARQVIPMVTAVKPEGERVLDPARPSLILRRYQGERLWDMAKASGSTAASIRKANALDADPVPGQLLLIPVK